MKRDFNKWLASLGPSAPVKSLTELRMFNLAHTGCRRDQVRPIAARYLRRDGSAMRIARATKPIAPRTSSSPRHAGHRRGAEGQFTWMLSCFPAPAGAAIAAKPGYPDRDRSLRHGPQRSDAAVPDRFQRPDQRRSASASPAPPAASRGSSNWPTLSNKPPSGVLRRPRLPETLEVDHATRCATSSHPRGSSPANRACLGSGRTSSRAGSIDLISQPSEKASRNSACDTRLGPSVPGI